MESLIIRADAGTKIGTGHLMRCLALGQAWKDAGGKVTFITACQNGGLLQRLKEEGFDLHPLASPYPDPGDWDYTKDILVAHPDAWVALDGYHFDEAYQQRVKKTGHRLLVIDDLAHLKHYYADILLNQNLRAEKLHYPCEPDTRLLLGTRYVLLRREFLARRDRQREIPEVAKRVLVTLGGSDPENHTLKVIQALQKVDVPNLEATVIIGASNPHADALEKAIKQNHIPICFTHNAGNMPELMAPADIAIIGGGVTLWELLFMGCAIISYVRNSAQEAIIQELDRQKVLRYQGYLAQMDQDSLSSAIHELSTNQVRRDAIRKLGRQIVDGKGTERILNAITDFC